MPTSGVAVSAREPRHEFRHSGTGNARNGRQIETIDSTASSRYFPKAPMVYLLLKRKLCLATESAD